MEHLPVFKALCGPIRNRMQGWSTSPIQNTSSLLRLYAGHLIIFKAPCENVPWVTHLQRMDVNKSNPLKLLVLKVRLSTTYVQNNECRIFFKNLQFFFCFTRRVLCQCTKISIGQYGLQDLSHSYGLVLLN